MFIGAETRLTVGFGQAQARLANLVRGGLLGRASEGAYDEWRAALVRDGPRGTARWGAVLGMSRLARVQVREAVARGDLAIWPLRWEVTGPPGALVPVLDADIKLIPAGADATMLAVSAVCRPQLAGLDTGLDQMIMRRCAQATIRAFTHRIAAAVMHPAGPSGARHHVAGDGLTGLIEEGRPWRRPSRRGTSGSRRAGWQSACRPGALGWPG